MVAKTLTLARLSYAIIVGNIEDIKFSCLVMGIANEIANTGVAKVTIVQLKFNHMEKTKERIENNILKYKKIPK